jgi:hypothetical protein
LLQSGQLDAVKIGGATRVTHASLVRFVTALPSVGRKP